MLQSNFEGHDEPSQLAAYLSNCAQTFLRAERVQVIPALRCLYAAAALVLPAQFEAEIRLQLGNVLLDHTQNSQEALNQVQKAHHLALSSSGAIKFDDKCRMTRSLIDALNRTEAMNLAQSILEDITVEAISVGNDSGWNWFVHFALMGLQLKFERGALPQVLLDLDRLLQLISQQQPSNPLIFASKILFLCFLNVILATDRKIMSVFMTLPKALQELRQALDEIVVNQETFGAIILGEFTCLLHSIPFADDQSRPLGRLDELLNGIEDVYLSLPGHLQFVQVSDARLIFKLLHIISSRQQFVPYTQLQASIAALQQELSQSQSFLADTIEMVLAGFKMSIELDVGKISQVAKIDRPNADPEFAKTFRDFILSFTAHTLIGKLGIQKVTSFYDKKLAVTTAVDLSCLLHLNKLLAKRSTEEFGAALQGAVQNLHIPQLQLLFHVLQVVEMRTLGAPAHHIRDVLSAAKGLVDQLSGREPMLLCWLHLLQGEYFEPIDFDASITHYQAAYSTAKEQLGNQRLFKVAAGKLVKIYQMIGDDSALISQLMFQGHSNQHSQQQQQQQQQGHGQSQVQGSSLPPLLQPGRLPELVMAGTGHNERIEGAVEHALNKIAEEFLDEIVASAAELAIHRGSSVIEAQDLLLPLERNYDLGVANFLGTESRPKITEARYRQLMFGTEAHQARKQQVNRTNK